MNKKELFLTELNTIYIICKNVEKKDHKSNQHKIVV